MSFQKQSFQQILGGLHLPRSRKFHSERFYSIEAGMNSIEYMSKYAFFKKEWPGLLGIAKRTKHLEIRIILDDGLIHKWFIVLVRKDDI